MKVTGPPSESVLEGLAMKPTELSQPAVCASLASSLGALAEDVWEGLTLAACIFFRKSHKDHHLLFSLNFHLASTFTSKIFH